MPGNQPGMHIPRVQVTGRKVRVISVVANLLDLIYPPRCLICAGFLCEKEASVNGQRIYFCRDCLSSLAVVESPFCPVCSSPLETGGADRVCRECNTHPPSFDMLVAPYLYESPLMECIHQFKYRPKPHMGDSLGPLLASFAHETLYGMDHPLLIPVPLHKKKLRERGFNQALVLARHVANALRGEIDFVSLKRHRATVPQTELDKKQRKRNVRGAFVLADSDKISDREVILVDDVATTGSTLNECAKLLKKAGAREVVALVLARAAI